MDGERDASVMHIRRGGRIMTDMGTFRTTIQIENVAERGRIATIDNVLVDTGSEYTFVPRALLESMNVRVERTQLFRVADGRSIERELGFAVVHAAGVFAPDFVVFAEPSDMVLLGARSLEGLNLRVDPVSKRLVDAGPVVAGVA
jgi:predicted aspartyl protease